MLNIKGIFLILLFSIFMWSCSEGTTNPPDFKFDSETNTFVDTNTFTDTDSNSTSDTGSDTVTESDSNTDDTSVDTVDSDTGVDTAVSDTGSDTVDSDTGVDTADSDTGLDTADSDTGVDTVDSDTGIDTADSDTGVDTADSDTGVDTADSDTGVDTVDSDTGIDTADSDTGVDTVDSDTGIDTADSDTVCQYDCVNSEWACNGEIQYGGGGGVIAGSCVPTAANGWSSICCNFSGIDTGVDTVDSDTGVDTVDSDTGVDTVDTDTGVDTVDSDTGSDTDPDMTAAQIVADMNIGWNLGNSLDAEGSETAWNNPIVTRELINAVAAEGFGAVRIPVTWAPHIGPGPNYTIDANWMNRVDEVVGYVLDAGMYAIINLHHDGADAYTAVEWITLNDASGNVTYANNLAVEQKFTTVWTQIADHFKNHSQHLIFESMNEIHDGYGDPQSVYYDIINNLNQVFVDVVRGTGANNSSRALIVPGYNTNINYTVAGFQLPDDSAANKLILTVHYYDPWTFAGEGSTTVWGAAYPGSDDFGQEDYVITQFNKLKTTYIDKGTPVILGEYGAVNVTGYENYRRYYMEYVTKAAHDRGIAPIYWDNGGTGSGADNFGLISRYSPYSELFSDILDAMMRAATSSYSINDISTP
ncbi:MAG: cellulase family glycosylhydrolase [Deltaproteobacteria bacterium]|nr:cellulase family glycosylhydrolase [Deltaproteobacteria bacterium]